MRRRKRDSVGEMKRIGSTQVESNVFTRNRNKLNSEVSGASVVLPFLV